MHAQLLYETINHQTMPRSLTLAFNKFILVELDTGEGKVMQGKEIFKIQNSHCWCFYVLPAPTRLNDYGHSVVGQSVCVHVSVFTPVPNC